MKWLSSFLLVAGIAMVQPVLAQTEADTDSTKSTYGFNFGLHTGARVEFWDQQLYSQDIRFAVYRKRFSFEVGMMLGVYKLQDNRGNYPAAVSFTDVSGMHFNGSYLWRLSPQSRWTFPTALGLAFHYRDYSYPGFRNPANETHWDLFQNFNTVDVMQGISWRFAGQWNLRLDGIYCLPFSWSSRAAFLVPDPDSPGNMMFAFQDQKKPSGIFTMRFGLGYRFRYVSSGDCDCDAPLPKTK